jgi:hypothetical protein
MRIQPRIPADPTEDPLPLYVVPSVVFGHPLITQGSSVSSSCFPFRRFAPPPCLTAHRHSSALFATIYRPMARGPARPSALRHNSTSQLPYSLVQFARDHSVTVATLRVVSLAYIIFLFVVAVNTGHSLYWHLHIDGEGCMDLHTSLVNLPVWPALDRFDHIGCIFGYQPLLWMNLTAILLVMPYQHVPYLTTAGSRTLAAYCFMQVPRSRI